MDPAISADGDLPPAPLEPTEIIGGKTHLPAPRGICEAPDFKYKSLGVDKGVPVRPLNPNPF